MHTLELLSSWFISATVRGSLLALAVLALQAALRGRMPARWQYALWLPVVFVLISPGLLESRWSLENHFFPANIRAEQPARDVAPAVALDSAPRADAPPTMPLEPASAPRADWRRFAQIGWLAGAACLLAFALAAYARTLRRVFHHAVPAEPAVTAMLAEAALIAGVRHAPRLVVSAAVQSPAVCGFLRPVLLLPAGFPGAFTREEARLVLLHELMHVKRHDLPLNWLLCLLQAVHWCNPILWFAFARIRADREAACDAQVLAATAADSRADYGHALLKLEGALARPGLSLGFVGIFERAAGVGARVRAIASYRRAHPAWGMLGAGLIAAITLAGATRAQRPLEGNAPDPSAPTAEIRRKLETIIIPRLEFRGASLREALDFLAKKSVELDASETDPAKRGVRIVLNLDAARNPAQAPPAPAMNPSDARITLALTNIPLIEALRYVTSLAALKFRIEPQAVEVVPQNTPERLLTKEWKVSPEAGFTAGKNPRELLELSSVLFPPGATAALSSDGRRLVMKNTEENLDRVDALLAAFGAPEQAAPSDETQKTKGLNDKLSAIVIPRLQFRNATLREAVDFLKRKSVELDTTEPDPARRGVNIVLKLDSAPPAVAGVPGLEAVPIQPADRDINNTRLTLSLTNIPLGEALKYVTSLANVKFRVEPYAVAIVPLTTPGGPLITKEWRLNDAALVALAIAPGRDAKAGLVTIGVTFPPGATARWVPLSRSLVMRNTQENLDLVDGVLLKAADSGTAPGR